MTRLLLPSLTILTMGAMLSGPQQETQPTQADTSSLGCITRLVGTSQIAWDADLVAATDAAALDPEHVIEFLVSLLSSEELVRGESHESQIYTVSGNALTLLEHITDERICGADHPWIGFSTHNHRYELTSQNVSQKHWTAWLHSRASLPADTWFWGTSLANIQRAASVLRTESSGWSKDRIAVVTALGPDIYPYLLAKLLDNDVAVGVELYCTQAHRLLAKLTGLDLGSLEQTALLGLSAEDPLRANRTVVYRNKASRSLMQQRWCAALLER